MSAAAQAGAWQAILKTTPPSIIVLIGDREFHAKTPKDETLASLRLCVTVTVQPVAIERG